MRVSAFYTFFGSDLQYGLFAKPYRPESLQNES